MSDGWIYEAILAKAIDWLETHVLKQQ